MTEQHQQAMKHLTQQSLDQFAETVTTILRETREQEAAEQGIGTVHTVERSIPADTDISLAGNQPRLRDPGVILQELTAHLPHLAANEEDALKVIHMYQRGMDRTTIRDALHFGTNKYSAIIKAIGDAVQAGQVTLFTNTLPLAHDEPKAQTEHQPGHTAHPGGTNHLSILPSMQQEAINGHEQQTDAIPVLLVNIGTTRMERHNERTQDRARSFRETADLASK